MIADWTSIINTLIICTTIIGVFYVARKNK